MPKYSQLLGYSQLRLLEKEQTRITVRIRLQSREGKLVLLNHSPCTHRKESKIQQKRNITEGGKVTLLHEVKMGIG